MFFRNICVQKNPSKHIPYYKGNASKSYNPYLLNIFDILVYLYHIHHLLSSTFYHNFIYNDSGVKSPGYGARLAYCTKNVRATDFCAMEVRLINRGSLCWTRFTFSEAQRNAPHNGRRTTFLCKLPSALRSQGFWHPNPYRKLRHSVVSRQERMRSILWNRPLGQFFFTHMGV